MEYIDFKTLNMILSSTEKSVWKIEPMTKNVYKIRTSWEEAIVTTNPEKGIINYRWL